jgi:hypothetical protein
VFIVASWKSASFPKCHCRLFFEAFRFCFVLRVRPVSAIRIRGIVDHLKEFGMLARELKLFAHLGEAGATKFLVEQFEYGGHRHPHRRNSRSEIFCFLLDGSVMRAVCRLRQPKAERGGYSAYTSENGAAFIIQFTHHRKLLFQLDFVSQPERAAAWRKIQLQRERDDQWMQASSAATRLVGLVV